MDSSGLKYTSIEMLLSQSHLTEQQALKYEELSCDNLYNSIKKLMEASAKARGDLENQYKFLMRTGELATILVNNPLFKTWDAGKKVIFYHEYEKCVEEASKLQTVLKKKYESAQVRRDTLDRAASEQTEKKKAIDRLITPLELIRRVESNSSRESAVIFDLRKDQTDTISYTRSEMITVIQVPHALIDSRLIFSSLRSNLDVNQRALLPRISESDYVVLMDDDTPELVNGDPAPETHVCFLFRALTDYNSPSLRLRERPMFMKGGFQLWKSQYPLYTTIIKQQPRSTPTDELDIEIYKLGELKYPKLDSSASSVSEQTDPPSVRLAVSPPQSGYEAPKPETLVQPQRFPTVPPNIPPRPTAFNATPKPPQQPPPAKHPLHPPDRSSKPYTMPERPTLLIKKDSSRQNGGGDLKRPPLLDRNTKPFNQAVTREYEGQLFSIYHQMVNAIERCSRKANSPLPGATGLYNMGNTCFMSATLQCLFQTPGLPEVFTKRAFVSKLNVENRMGSKGVVSAAFAALMDLIWSGEYEVIKPARFLQLFADYVSNILSDGKQHDASEFQIFLLDALHEDTNQAKRIGYEQNYRGGTVIAAEAADFLRRQQMFSSSPVNRMFGGVSVSEIRCRTCGESSATFEENTLISVELTSTSTCTLDSCLRSHFSETILDGDSRWNCPKCRQPRLSTRSSKLWALPSIMIIHLKRFALSNGEFEKNLAAVTFDPNRLDARPYLHESAAQEKATYRLYATTIHNGRLNSGHYTSVALHLRSEKWLRFDDESVRPIDRYSVDPSLAYILFYKRC
uniref:Ubiquitin carboxyl-terminal hydrolase n=1 Tax=Caenorhabditis japonica TaxID=281687 RepID=A0A8R1HQZ5_CAEJA